MRHVLAVWPCKCDYVAEWSTSDEDRRQVSRQVWYFSVTRNHLQYIYTRSSAFDDRGANTEG